MLQAHLGGSVYGQSFGPGEPEIVWLHGWARQSADFAAAAGVVAERGIGSIAFDLPGFGASPPPPAGLTPTGYAGLVEPAVAALGAGPYVLVGHSFGGCVALALAAAHPELVKGLVLTGAPLLTRPPAKTSSAYRVIRWLHRVGVVPESVVESARRRYGSKDYAAAHGVMRDVLVASVHQSYEAELQQWRGPLTLLWGANDLEVPVTVAERAGELAPNTRLVVLAGVGHFVPTVAAGDLAEAAFALL